MYFAKKLLRRLTRVNSHQRWKQTRFRVCLHLWCELTNTMSAIGYTALIIFWQNSLPANIRKWVFSWNERDGITWRNYMFAWNSWGPSKWLNMKSWIWRHIQIGDIATQYFCKNDDRKLQKAVKRLKRNRIAESIHLLSNTNGIRPGIVATYRTGIH